MNYTPEIEILLIEDNEGDIRLAKEALIGSKIKNRLSIVKDGQQALEFLHKQDGYEKAVRPDLILLDLNLPKMDGRELLKKIKTDPSLKKIPVVILTTSQAEEDITETYYNYANSFITKPIDWEQFIDVIRSIEDFWLRIVKLPNKDEE